MNQNLGKLLSDLRKEKGLTQQELAKRLFVSDKTVSKWETGNVVPDIFILIELSKFYDIPINSFFDKCDNTRDRHNNFLLCLLLISTFLNIIVYIMIFMFLVKGYALEIIAFLLCINVLISLISLFTIKKKEFYKNQSIISSCFFFNYLSGMMCLLMLIGCVILR